MMLAPKPSDSFEIRPTLAGRAKALGLAVLYFALVAGAIVAWTFLPAFHSHTLSLSRQFLQEAAWAASAIALLVVLSRLRREPMSHWGFATKGAARDFPLGLAVGFVLMAGSLGVIAAAGACKFSVGAVPTGQIMGAAVLFALRDLAVGLFEETFFRSFVLVHLSRAFSFWPAAIITAIVFGLAHGGNPHEAPIGLIVAAAGGLVLAYSFRHSGALWFAIGWHAAYDFTQDFIFGVPDSGNAVRQDTLLHATLHGPTWLTGGKVGPEASVVTFAALVVLVLFVRFRLVHRQT